MTYWIDELKKTGYTLETLPTIVCTDIGSTDLFDKYWPRQPENMPYNLFRFNIYVRLRNRRGYCVTINQYRLDEKLEPHQHINGKLYRREATTEAFMTRVPAPQLPVVVRRGYIYSRFYSYLNFNASRYFRGKVLDKVLSHAAETIVTDSFFRLR